MFKIIATFGTRAEAIKFAPLIQALKERKETFSLNVVVTAEHREQLDQVLRLFEITPNTILHVYVVYGWTNGEADDEAADRTNDAITHCINDAALQAKGPKLRAIVLQHFFLSQAFYMHWCRER